MEFINPNELKGPAKELACASSLEAGAYWWVGDKGRINYMKPNTLGSLGWSGEGIEEIVSELNAHSKAINARMKDFKFSAPEENKIARIKEIRAAFGLDLRKAKEIVEGISNIPYFTPFTGVKELEGYGHFGDDLKIWPLEAAEVLGYNVGEPQVVEYPNIWAIYYYEGLGYNIVPLFSDKAKLGFDTFSNKVVKPRDIQDIIYDSADLFRVLHIRALLAEARKAGREDLISYIKSIID